jgi:hypothetical protein
MAIQIPRYEFKILSAPTGNQVGPVQEFEKTLRKLGEEGWDLVTVDEGKVYLKRQTGFVQQPD